MLTRLSASENTNKARLANTAIRKTRKFRDKPSKEPARSRLSTGPGKATHAAQRPEIQAYPLFTMSVISAFRHCETRNFVSFLLDVLFGAAVSSSGIAEGLVEPVGIEPTT